jgi:hypothetical protein
MAAYALSAPSDSSSRDESFHSTMVNAAGDRRMDAERRCVGERWNGNNGSSTGGLATE